MADAHGHQLGTVQPDAEFECMGVLMSHTQDVKCVAWHPTEEVVVSVIISPLEPRLMLFLLVSTSASLDSRIRVL